MLTNICLKLRIFLRGCMAEFVFQNEKQIFFRKIVYIFERLGTSSILEN